MDFVGLLGHSTGGRPGERLMQRLGMPVSDDTILRQLKRDAAVAHRSNAEIRVVGIDDWSWRRATIMVDLERRSVVDILDDRSVQSAARWLRDHPSVEVVSRDRCGLYAQAVSQGAQQVADRFHLIQNLRSAIEEQMSLSGRATGRAILSEDAIVDAAAAARCQSKRESTLQSARLIQSRRRKQSKAHRYQRSYSRQNSPQACFRYRAFHVVSSRRRSPLAPGWAGYFAGVV